MRAIDAVCFDLDGTLCVSTQDPAALLRRAFDAADLEPRFARADVEAVDQATLPTAATQREFFMQLFAAAAERAGATMDTNALATVTDAYLDRYDRTAVSVRPGARPLVAAVADRYPVGLVTNGPETTQHAKLERLGLADYFDVAVCCGLQSGLATKPDPAGLHAAMDELAVGPERTLFVGDSLRSDIAAARAAGTHSVWVPHGTPVERPPPEPTHRAASMAAVHDLLLADSA